MASGFLMALAYKPGGSDESCNTARKLFVLPLSCRYVTLTHPKRIVPVNVLQRRRVGQSDQNSTQTWK